MPRQWKRIPSCPGYVASNEGDVVNTDGNRILRGNDDGKRVRVLMAAYGSKAKHRLVWEAFNGEIPHGHSIHHIDGDHTNNRLDNLQLVSEREHRLIHIAENGTHHEAQTDPDTVKALFRAVECGRYNIKDAAEHFGVSYEIAHAIVSGDSWAWLTGKVKPTKTRKRVALTENQAQDAYDMVTKHEASIANVAKCFGVSEAAINHICTGRNWPNLDRSVPYISGVERMRALSDDDVREIYRLVTKDYRPKKKVADMYGVDPAVIHNIVKGKSYRHVERE
jgi:hypothetical protein